MDIRTGEMFSMEEVEKMPQKEKKYFVEIPNKFLPQLEGMNRHQRRRWLKENRKNFS